MPSSFVENYKAKHQHPLNRLTHSIGIPMIAVSLPATSRSLIERAAAKWPLRILHVLSDAGAPLRFSRLMERVEGISQKVLTQTLRTLESDGLIIRTLYPEVPPRVEYELTPLGFDLLMQVATLWRWIVERLGDFDARNAVKLTATSV